MTDIQKEMDLLNKKLDLVTTQNYLLMSHFNVFELSLSEYVMKPLAKNECKDEAIPEYLIKAKANIENFNSKLIKHQSEIDKMEGKNNEIQKTTS